MSSIKLRLIGGIHYGPITITVTRLDTHKSEVQQTRASSHKPIRDYDFHLSPDPTAVRITIAIPRPDWIQSGHAEPDATERIELHLEKSVSSPEGFGLPSGSFPHPRLIHHEQLGGSQGTLLVIDLTFLEVTPYFPEDALGPLSGQTKYLLVRRQPRNHYPKDVYTRRRPDACLLRLYELTVGEPPRLWAVSYVPAVLESLPFHFVVFLMPKAPRYDHPGEAWLGNLKRYLLSPPLAAPFFLRNEANSIQWKLRAKLRWMQNPDCGYMEQLWRSGANAVLITPVPCGEEPSDPRYRILLSSREPASKLEAARLPPFRKGLRGLLDSLRRALLRNRTIRVGSMREARLALGGFSAGAHDAAGVLQRNMSTIEQFYWFDPRTEWVRSFEPMLGTWLQLDGHKQLRLVGGNQHSPRPGFARPNPLYTLLALRDRLAPRFGSQRVTLLPDSPGFFNSYMYGSAVAGAPHALLQIESFNRSTESASWGPVIEGYSWNKKKKEYEVITRPGWLLSGSSGVFVEQYEGATQPLILEGRPGDAPPRPRPQRDLAAVPCNSLEAAGLIRVKYLLTPHGPDKKHFPPLYAAPSGPRMKNDVALWLARATEDTRHQWAACGGDGDPLRDAKFIGHLHDCMVRGGL